MGQRSFDDFDAYAEDYRAIHTENVKLSGADSFYFAKMKVQLLTATENNVPLKLLDIGCGDGATELYFQEYFPSWKINGIDVSSKSIDIASGRRLPNAVFEVYDGSTTNFESEIFDIVFIAGVLHHMNFEMHDKLIKEVYRVLKKGGRVYVFEHNPLNPVTRQLVNTCVFDKDAKLLNSIYTSRLLKRSKLQIQKKKFIIFFPRKGILSAFIFLENSLGWLPLGGQYFIQAMK